MTRRATWAFLTLVSACVLSALPAAATAPPGRYTIANGAVTDNRTGLVWQQTVDANSYTQAAAMTYCAGLNLGGFSSGWRLPTVGELLSIVDPTAPSPALDPTAFPNTPTNYFMTASTFVGTTGSVWTVSGFDGSSSSGAPNSPLRVRCVH